MSPTLKPGVGQAMAKARARAHGDRQEDDHLCAAVEDRWGTFWCGVHAWSLAAGPSAAAPAWRPVLQGLQDRASRPQGWPGTASPDS